jgi:serine/threonine-protein kinase
MIGTRLGPWIIDVEIGRGGMGTVYRAHLDLPEEEASEPAAIKVLAAELSVEVGFRQRFQREIEVLRQLDHPNIVRFFESGEDRGRYYYAMEYVAGPTYEQLLRQHRKLPWRDVLEMAWQLAPALKHAHDRGIIHRDIKPSNLMLAPPDPAAPDQPGQAKLGDFGIASLFASSHLTVTGSVLGTPEYLSPEQAAGKPVTRRSDLYSLGVCLYTLVTGRTPFAGEPVDLLHKHRFAQFDRPIRLVPMMHHEFDEIICNLLDKDPSQRPGDASVLFRQLDSLRRKLEYQARVQTQPLQTTRDEDERRRPEEGPATLMSRLMRRELERQNAGGPLRRFINQPLVLVALFILTIGTIGYAFWPLRPQTMYDRAAALMESTDADDWDRAWTKYLEPLHEKHPDFRPEEVAELRQRYQDRQAEQQAEVAARRAGPMSEARWFFEQGLRLRRRGDEAGARRTWQALLDAFGEVPAEKPWVRKARDELEGAGPGDGPSWRSLRVALKKARDLRREGKKDEAQAIVRGLKKLYKDDRAARAILDREE